MIAKLLLLNLIILFSISAIAQNKADTIYLSAKRDTIFLKSIKDTSFNKRLSADADRLRKLLSKKPIIIIGDVIIDDKFETGEIDIVKVTVEKNQYHIIYFDKKGSLKEYVTNIKKDTIYKNVTFKPFALSIMAVPFKVRPTIGDIKQFVKADLKTFGIFLSPLNWNLKHYLRDGTVYEYKLSIGGLFAPSAEEFNSKNTDGKITDATTNLALSTGLTVAFTYRTISFAIIPAGFDIGLNKDANDWIYNKKYWYGFGIGIDSKLFGF